MGMQRRHPQPPRHHGHEVDADGVRAVVQEPALDAGGQVAGHRQYQRAETAHDHPLTQPVPPDGPQRSGHPVIGPRPLELDLDVQVGAGIKGPGQQRVQSRHLLRHVGGVQGVQGASVWQVQVVVNHQSTVCQPPHVQLHAVQTGVQRGLKAGHGVLAFGAGRTTVAQQERSGSSGGHAVRIARRDSAGGQPVRRFQRPRPAPVHRADRAHAPPPSGRAARSCGPGRARRGAAR